MNVASIHVYPVKGCRGIDLERAEVRRAGLLHDRRFMVLGADGTFLTQRKSPRMALVETAIEGETLRLTAGGSSARVELTPEGRPRRAIVWRDEVECVEIEGDAPALLSDFLGQACALVFMPERTIRPVEPAHAREGDRVGFADAYPVLLATRASLADLNARLGTPVPMTRFRPNVVVEGGAAWEEEAHDAVAIGPIAFRMPKRCARCEVTLVDQLTAEKGKEPLRTLATFRASDNNVYFAMNCIPDAEGTIRIGDDVRYSAIAPRETRS